MFFSYPFFIIIPAPLRKAIILSGGIPLLVNLLATSTAERNQLVYLEAISKLAVDGMNDTRRCL